uniref:Uncharacterized protein n=1 Tax=Anguilla anguilla TaxID=7936 RepID=A0A0E9PWG2_ANGAN
MHINILRSCHFAPFFLFLIHFSLSFCSAAFEKHHSRAWK